MALKSKHFNFITRGRIVDIYSKKYKLLVGLFYFHQHLKQHVFNFFGFEDLTQEKLNDLTTILKKLNNKEQ